MRNTPHQNLLFWQKALVSDFGGNGFNFNNYKERELKIQFGDPYESLEICAVSGSLPDNSGEIPLQRRTTLSYCTCMVASCEKVWLCVYKIHLFFMYADTVDLCSYLFQWKSRKSVILSKKQQATISRCHRGTVIYNHIDSPNSIGARMWERSFRICTAR